jgi:nitronate monooxygenase
VSDGPADRIRELSTLPIWVAPMAGGPSTTGLVTAAAQAGAFGFLAGGYKTAGALAAEMGTLRAAGTRDFGVNVFVPGAPAGDAAAVSAYIASLRVPGGEVGEPGWDDDGWADKIAVLLADPPAVVSFTFGCPPPETIAGLRRRGALVAITVTSPGEAGQAAAAGADCLIVQGREAGAHSGTFANDGTPDGRPALLDLLAEVAGVASDAGLPIIAAGGIADAAGVAAALGKGAAAASVGTAFLRCPESGAHPLHKAALADPRFTATAVTRAFSGRPARALVNRFLLDHPDARRVPGDQQRHPAAPGPGRRGGRCGRDEPVRGRGVPGRRRPPGRRDRRPARRAAAAVMPGRYGPGGSSPPGPRVVADPGAPGGLPERPGHHSVPSVPWAALILASPPPRPRRM